MSCSTLILETMLDDPTRLSKFRGDALIVSDVANRCKLTSNFITSRLEVISPLFSHTFYYF